MKKLLLSALFLVSIGTIKAQNIYNYGFTTGNAGLTTDGWQTTNQSNPATVRVWSIPAAAPTTTFDGGAQSLPASSFAIVDYTSVGTLITGPVGSSGSGPISNWLISPEITVKNGDLISFYTRKALISTSTTAVDYPDRLQLRMSTGGAFTVNPSSGSTDLGTFTNLLVDVNPTLIAGVYPRTWTKYTYTVAGIATPTSVKFAFRYFVTSGGAEGANSDRIGLDTFSVDTPEACAPPTALVSTLTNPTGSTISWTATATPPANGYEYYYSTINTAPTAATLASGNTAAGIVTTSLTGLMNNSSYYVWVRSVCSATEKGSWSSNPATFNTTVIPACAVLVSPANNAIGVINGTTATPIPVVFSWNAVPDATSYDYFYGATSAATNFLSNYTTTTASITVPGSNTLFYWKIIAKNAGGSAINCSAFNFTTLNTALATDTFSSNNFQSYPNPVKDVLNLSYDKDITNVSVINLLGQEVLTSKVNNTTAKIDMSSLTTGAYMVKVTSENEVKTIKVIKE